jgi:hypothetical protein
MRYARPFLVCRFCCANVHAAIEESRIGGDDLAVESLGKLDGDFCFAYRGWSDDENEKRFGSLGFK